VGVIPRTPASESAGGNGAEFGELLCGLSWTWYPERLQVKAQAMTEQDRRNALQAFVNTTPRAPASEGASGYGAELTCLTLWGCSALPVRQTIAYDGVLAE
jgi:hypothetical protein